MNDQTNQLPTQKTIELPEIDEPLAQAFARAYVDEDKNAQLSTQKLFSPLDTLFSEFGKK